jgi:exopolysaccharide transport family protein
MNVQTRLDGNESSSPLDGHNSAESTQITLLEIWQIVRMRARVIIGSAAAVFILAALAIFSLTPYYTGTAVVMLDNRANKVVDASSVLSGLSTDQASILNQIQILQSRQLAARVIAKAGLEQDPEFNSNLRMSWTKYLWWLDPHSWFPSPQVPPDVEAQKVHDAVVNKFESLLTVTQLELSTAIEIDFRSEQPAKAARIANAIAEAYVEDQLNAKFDATLKATQWLASRIGQLAEEARKAQDAVEAYKAANHIMEVTTAEGGGTISIVDQQMAGLDAQLIQSRTDVAQAEANLSRVRMLVSSGHAADVSSVVQSPLIAVLKQQQAALIEQEAQMSTRYGPDHPKMLDLQAQKRDLDAKINEEVQHVVGTAENDVAVARARQESLQDSLNRLESQSNVEGVARVKLRELQSNAASSQALYQSFVERAKATQQQEGAQIPDSRILSSSAIPLRPSFPNVPLYLAVAAAAALLTGFAVAYLLERLDHGFRTATRAERMLSLPVLATLPDVTPASALGVSLKRDKEKSEGSSVSAADLVVDRPLSSYAEAVRGLQLGIVLSNVDQVPKVVVVTSALPGEGKTTTSLSLARHVAQTGQSVVLVDGDLRRPNVMAQTGLTDIKRDLVDVLKGEATIDECLVQDSKSSVMLLPVARHVKNAPDLIESQSMAKLVADLRQRFDLVVIDSAPVLPVTDTRILTRLSDAVLFVIRWERTPRDAASDAVRSLRDVNATIAGIALTRADAKRFHYYSFGYGGYYYAYSKYYES